MHFLPYYFYSILALFFVQEKRARRTHTSKKKKRSKKKKMNRRYRATKEEQGESERFTRYFQRNQQRAHALALDAEAARVGGQRHRRNRQNIAVAAAAATTKKKRQRHMSSSQSSQSRSTTQPPLPPPDIPFCYPRLFKKRSTPAAAAADDDDDDEVEDPGSTKSDSEKFLAEAINAICRPFVRSILLRLQQQKQHERYEGGGGGGGTDDYDENGGKRRSSPHSPRVHEAIERDLIDTLLLGQVASALINQKKKEEGAGVDAKKAEIFERRRIGPPTAWAQLVSLPLVLIETNLGRDDANRTQTTTQKTIRKKNNKRPRGDDTVSSDSRTGTNSSSSFSSSTSSSSSTGSDNDSSTESESDEYDADDDSDDEEDDDGFDRAHIDDGNGNGVDAASGSVAAAVSYLHPLHIISDSIEGDFSTTVVPRRSFVDSVLQPALLKTTGTGIEPRTTTTTTATGPGQPSASPASASSVEYALEHFYGCVHSSSQEQRPNYIERKKNEEAKSKKQNKERDAKSDELRKELLQPSPLQLWPRVWQDVQGKIHNSSNSVSTSDNKSGGDRDAFARVNADAAVKANFEEVDDENAERMVRRRAVLHILGSLLQSLLLQVSIDGMLWQALLCYYRFYHYHVTTVTCPAVSNNSANRTVEQPADTSSSSPYEYEMNMKRSNGSSWQKKTLRVLNARLMQASKKKNLGEGRKAINDMRSCVKKIGAKVQGLMPSAESSSFPFTAPPSSEEVYSIHIIPRQLYRSYRKFTRDFLWPRLLLQEVAMLSALSPPGSSSSHQEEDPKSSSRLNRKNSCDGEGGDEEEEEEREMKRILCQNDVGGQSRVSSDSPPSAANTITTAVTMGPFMRRYFSLHCMEPVFDEREAQQETKTGTEDSVSTVEAGRSGGNGKCLPQYADEAHSCHVVEGILERSFSATVKKNRNRQLQQQQQEQQNNDGNSVVGVNDVMKVTKRATGKGETEGATPVVSPPPHVSWNASPVAPQPHAQKQHVQQQAKPLKKEVSVDGVRANTAGLNTSSTGSSGPPTSSDTDAWLASLPLNEHERQRFVEQHITPESFVLLSEEDLRSDALGPLRIGVRVELWRRIQVERQKQPPPFPPATPANNKSTVATATKKKMTRAATSADGPHNVASSETDEATTPSSFVAQLTELLQHDSNKRNEYSLRMEVEGVLVPEAPVMSSSFAVNNADPVLATHSFLPLLHSADVIKNMNKMVSAADTGKPHHQAPLKLFLPSDRICSVHEMLLLCGAFYYYHKSSAPHSHPGAAAAAAPSRSSALTLMTKTSAEDPKFAANSSALPQSHHLRLTSMIPVPPPSSPLFLPVSTMKAQIERILVAANSTAKPPKKTNKKKKQKRMTAPTGKQKEEGDKTEGQKKNVTNQNEEGTKDDEEQKVEQHQQQQKQNRVADQNQHKNNNNKDNNDPSCIRPFEPSADLATAYATQQIKSHDVDHNSKPCRTAFVAEEGQRQQSSSIKIHPSSSLLVPSQSSSSSSAPAHLLLHDERRDPQMAIVDLLQDCNRASHAEALLCHRILRCQTKICGDLRRLSALRTSRTHLEGRLLSHNSSYPLPQLAPADSTAGMMTHSPVSGMQHSSSSSNTNAGLTQQQRSDEKIRINENENANENRSRRSEHEPPRQQQERKEQQQRTRPTEATTLFSEFVDMMLKRRAALVVVVMAACHVFNSPL